MFPMLRKEFNLPKILTTTLSISLYLMLLMAAPERTYAQSLQDLGSVRVDQLTDSQIRQLVSQAQASGISSQQLPGIAQQRGMSSAEASKLRERISQLGISSGENRTYQQLQEGPQLRTPTSTDGLDIFESIVLTDSTSAGELTEFEKKIYGYSFFHNKALNFSPNFNMATPQNYTVGPGDQLIVQVYGVAQDSYSLDVTPEGKLNLPRLGLVHVGGFTIDAVTALLRQELGKIFSGLKMAQPNTFLSVTLGNVRTIKVNIVGELNNPGTFTIPSIATVFNALYAAGGPTTKGTFRNIQVYRSGKLVSELDIYQFLTKGQDGSNLGLEDNDVILIRPYEQRIEIQGAVRIPGYFEVKRGETLSDMLYYAGGFTESAFKDNVSVRRSTDIQKMVETISGSNYDKFEPRDGDVYLVGEIMDFYTNRVQVSGAVLRPGEYELENNMTVKGLVDKAGGLRGDAFLSRATLYRTSDEFTLQAQSVNIGAIIDGTADDLVLQNEDVLNIPSRYDVREEFYVEVSGEINRTGIFPFAENLTVGDLVLKAGGFKESASNSSIEIARRVRNDVSGKIAEIITLSISKGLELTEEDQAFKLEPFDHVFIRRSPGYREQKLVTVEGEVNYPGTYALENATMRISDLVRRAGGINQFGYPKGATLVRRTEFYQEANTDELVAENLRKLRQNTYRSEIDNPASEKLILERIDKKLKDREEEIAKKQQKEAEEELSTQFRADLLADLTSSGGEIKETELVGINLDMIMAAPGSKYDLILQEGDILNVPKELQTVRLRGEVLYPTTTRYDASRGFRNYISSAGGFSDQAGRKKSYVIYANGNVKRTRSLLWIRDYPSIEPGAEIIVPVAAPRTSIQQSLNNIIGVTTSLLTLYFILNNTIPRQ